VHRKVREGVAVQARPEQVLLLEAGEVEHGGALGGGDVVLGTGGDLHERFHQRIVSTGARCSRPPMQAPASPVMDGSADGPPDRAAARRCASVLSARTAVLSPRTAVPPVGPASPVVCVASTTLIEEIP